MDQQEILHAIVKTDLDARALYDEAIRKRNALGESLREKTEEIRREYFARADERIAEFEKNEIENADIEIAAIDREFGGSLRDARAFFEANKESIALKLFNIVIDQSAGEEDA